MVGIFAAGGNPLEIVVGRPVVPFGKGDIAHADVVLLAPRSAQGLVFDPFKRLARQFHVSDRTIVRAQGKAHVIGIDRAGIAGIEVAERSFGIGTAQLHGTGRQIVVDLLAGSPVGRFEGGPGLQEFMARIAPTTVVEQIASPGKGRLKITLRLRRSRTKEQKRQQHIPNFSHRLHSYDGQR